MFLIALKNLLISSEIGRRLDLWVRYIFEIFSLVLVFFKRIDPLEDTTHLVFNLIDGIGDNVYVLKLIKDFYKSGFRNISVIVDESQAPLIYKISNMDVEVVFHNKRQLNLSGKIVSRIQRGIAVRTNPTLEHTLAFRLHGVWRDIGFVGSYRWFRAKKGLERVDLDKFDPQKLPLRYDPFYEFFKLTRSDGPLFDNIQDTSKFALRSPYLVVALDKSRLWKMPSAIEVDSLIGPLKKPAVESGWTIVIVGERPKDGFSFTGPCVDLCGQTSIGEFVDILSCADLVVTVDNGPMHISVAQRRPTASVFTFTSPLHFLPTGGDIRAFSKPVPCSPCVIPKLNAVNNYYPICRFNFRCSVNDCSDVINYIVARMGIKGDQFLQ